MRTTIDLPDTQRARLLALAAERGEKGFSGIVQEALEKYFEEQRQREEALRRARAVHGTLSDEEAEALEEHVKDLRRSWR
ncbi:MAG: hypothetical protein KDD47_12700 [Acidobacteria bacterium]|nr:hypothetical protein [Acidobacteriota bacterium]